MNDEPITELFSAYLDGELTADEQLGVEHLLSTDPSARQLLDDMRAVGSTLQALPQQKVGEDLSQRVLDVAARRLLVGDLADGGAADLGSSAAASGDQTRTVARTTNDAELKPLWKELSWRGLFSSRALAWSGIAVALAILISWNEWRQKPAVGPVALVIHNKDDIKSNNRADAAREMPKAGEAANNVTSHGMLSKSTASTSDKRKATEMSSADAPASGRAPEGRAANWRAVASDAAEPEIAGQADKSPRAEQDSLGLRTQMHSDQQQTAPQGEVERQNKDRGAAAQSEGEESVASRGSGGRRRELNANDSAKKLSENLPKDAKAQADRIAVAEKPAAAAPLDAPMVAAAPAKPSAAGNPSAAKGDEGKQIALADEHFGAKRAMTIDRIVVRLDCTRQAANDRVFERLLAETGLITQSHDGDKVVAQDSSANLNVLGGANYAGLGGGLSQVTPPVSAPNGNLSNGNSGAGNFGYGNTAYSSSATIFSQNGTTQNGIAQNNAPQNFAIQNGTQSYSGGQFSASENAVTQNAAPALTPTQPMQNLQLPANLSTTDNMNLTGNSGATVRLGPILGPAPRVVEVDANAAQVADLRKALVGNHNAFPSVSFPRDVEQLDRLSGDGKDMHTRNLKQESGSLRLAAPQSNAAAKSPTTAKAAGNLTHILFELRVVDSISGVPSALSINGGSLQSSSSPANNFQFSGTGVISLTGSANYQNVPGIAVPTPAGPASPPATAPSPSSKH